LTLSGLEFRLQAVRAYPAICRVNAELQTLTTISLRTMSSYAPGARLPWPPRPDSMGEIRRENRFMKKRILFVDDEPLQLSVYAMMMEDSAAAWELACAGSGREALEILAGERFDVVVSDMRMPGMDGAELMTEICRRQPQVSRIIISGIDDQEEIARCLETTHQFLAKPVREAELLATLACIRQLDAYLQDEPLKALVGKLDTLPSFPAIYLKIMREINADEPSIEDIADIVVQDPGLTAKMLQVANSAAFGLPQKVSSAFEAVQFLGLSAVRSIALSAHVFSSFDAPHIPGFSAHNLWDDALRCAHITRVIMQMETADENRTEDACTAAMLRDAGRLMLAQNLPQQCRQAATRAGERRIPLPEAEREIFGVTHAGVAAYLFGLWGLPAPMVQAVAFHLEPGKSGPGSFGPVAAVHVANVFTLGFSRDPSPGKPLALDLDYLSAAGVLNRLDDWRAKIKGLLAPGV